MGQRPLVMWSAVCSAPHSQLSFVDNPQRSMLAPNLPTPVRSLFSRVQARRDRPTPCPLFDGVGMNLCSLVVVENLRPLLFLASRLIQRPVHQSYGLVKCTVGLTSWTGKKVCIW